MSVFQCKVSRAGVKEDGTILINIKDVNGSFDWRWFFAPVSVRKESLATALAAVTTGLQVEAHLDSISEYSYLKGIYLVNFS